MFMSPDEFPLPWEYRGLHLRAAWSARRPTTWPSARSSSSTAATSTACRSTSSRPTGSTSSTSTTTTTTRASARSTWWCPTASCTAEIVWRPRQGAGRRDHAARSPNALYVGLVTDTGRFMYENTDAGGPPDGGRADRGRRRAARGLPRALRGPALPPAPAAPARAGDASSATTTARSRSRTSTKGDYEETGALETDSEGVVDHMRAVEGTRVAVLVRELLADDRDGMRKVSLRATDGSRGRVADRARVRRRRPPAGGGLLDRAAVPDELVDAAARARARAARRTAERARWTARPAPREAGGRDLARRRGRGAPLAAARDEGRARRHARPVRHRPAAGAGRAARRARSAS